MKTLFLSTLALISLSISAQTTTLKTYAAGNPSKETTSPWMTDGGSCRIGVYENDKYSHDLDFNVEIDNDKNSYKNDAKCNINNQMIIIRVDKNGNTVNYIFVPFSFYVEGDESIVDHYEACCYIHKNTGTYPLRDARDSNGTFIGQNGNHLETATVEPTLTYEVPVKPQLSEGQNMYDAYKMTTINGKVSSAEGILLEDEGNGVVTATLYVRVIFKEETGLEPVCYDLHNVHNHIDARHIVTEVNDINVEEDATPVYYDLNGRMVNADQLNKGIYIKRTGSKSEKIMIR